ncbi:unnamed protein product [Dimorphilus gyrociliatus]|uniref:Uncharacterized protein n=1 Tax=Dimorphilus gyrociliatus TaxID=2664684 RepID=A0A7I8VED6_9ANNE|nr:unnamed protein product [Dimorphilus gyrociliatus]
MLFCRTCKNKRVDSTKPESTRTDEAGASDLDQHRNSTGDNRLARNRPPVPTAPPTCAPGTVSQNCYPRGPLPSYDECLY